MRDQVSIKNRWSGDHCNVWVPSPSVSAVNPLPSKFTQAVYLNIQPYARKIERGESPQFPDGVYQAVAAIASRRFSNLAKITFTFEAPVGGNSALEQWASQTTQWSSKAGSDVNWNRRQPAILIELR